jgi:YD repeat-containing protein
LTALTDALNEVTSFGYDANGYQQTVTDALGRVTTTLHDVMGRTTATIDALGDRGTFTYNAAGEQLTATDQLGRQASTIYDSYNRGLVAEAPVPFAKILAAQRLETSAEIPRAARATEGGFVKGFPAPQRHEGRQAAQALPWT